MIRLTKDEIKAIESVLNRRLTSKYDWFKGISINKIYYKPGDSSYFTIVGEIKVDETWGYKQWKEY